MTHVETQLGHLLSYFPAESLQNLDRAFEQKRVIARSYCDTRGNGCLLWHLDHCINSREARVRTFGFDPDLLRASEDVVRAWDLGLLPHETVRRAIERMLVQRRKAEHARNERVQSARVA